MKHHSDVCRVFAFPPFLSPAKKTAPVSLTSMCERQQTQRKCMKLLKKKKNREISVLLMCGQLLAAPGSRKWIHRAAKKQAQRKKDSREKGEEWRRSLSLSALPAFQYSDVPTHMGPRNEPQRRERPKRFLFCKTI